ncbi:hypothetical protein KKA15_03655 [Patescibacteria group bacterium]|nr:hypothetical protein [Patescibacteria group bacterium]
MKHFVKLKATIRISEYFKAETEVDAVIYRREFERYYKEYLKTKDSTKLIFTFILLQIYVECFLHQNMRRIICMEFKPPSDGICTTWLEGEKKSVKDKINNFVSLFPGLVPTDTQQLVDIIEDGFKNLSDIRNLFVHGHKVAEWSDSKKAKESSPAKQFLTATQIKKIIAEINALGGAWDKLLDYILPQCKALTRIDNFKFTKI